MTISIPLKENTSGATPEEELPAIITVPREKIVKMLERAAWNVGVGSVIRTTVYVLGGAARNVGVELRGFYELGKDDNRLDDPWLRDLWLIWGDVLTEEDVITEDTPSLS